MHYAWDTKMSKTDPPQLGGTKGGGMFEVWRMGEMRETSSSYRAAHCDGSIAGGVGALRAAQTAQYRPV